MKMIMEEQKIKEIVITNNISFTFPKIETSKGDMLIIGNFNGICGEFNWDKRGMGNFFDGGFINENVFTIAETLKNGHRIVLASSKETIKYFQRVIFCLMDMGTFGEYLTDKQKKRIFNRVWAIDTTDIYTYTYKKYNATTSKRRESATDNIDKVVLNKIYKRIEKMKFDVVIQNPPYNGSLHLDFLEKGLDVLTETGKMVIIEPATWLINVRKNGKAKRYDAIKQRINGHIDSVVIENLNKEFGTANDTPFAITTIDMSKTFDTIDYTCCGEHKVVKSVYDCNLVGNYKTIWNIFEKVQSFGDMMSNHIFNPKNDIQYEAYLRYWKYQLYALGSNYGNVVNQYNDKTIAVYRNLPIGEYFSSYVDSLFYGEVSGNKPLSRKGNLCDCLCGNKTELENWAYNVSNNKLFLFLTICTIFDKHNDATNLFPFLADKKYTNNEIEKLFNFTKDEINLIDSVLNKFHYDSPWFKRYMCGKDAVSDEEINNFIAEISK